MDGLLGVGSGLGRLRLGDLSIGFAAAAHRGLEEWGGRRGRRGRVREEGDGLEGIVGAVDGGGERRCVN